MFAFGVQRPINVISTKLRFKARRFEASTAAQDCARAFWQEDVGLHAWRFETDFEYGESSTISVPDGVDWYILPGVTWAHHSTLFQIRSPQSSLTTCWLFQQ